MRTKTANIQMRIPLILRTLPHITRVITNNINERLEGIKIVKAASAIEINSKKTKNCPQKLI